MLEYDTVHNCTLNIGTVCERGSETMYYSDKWQDYRIIDTSGGEKLEKWKKYSLIRPDPQVIWNTEKKNPLWQSADASYRRSNSGGGAWNKNRLPESWTVRYGELEFLIKPMGFKHTGLFPEQAVNWKLVSDIISGREYIYQQYRQLGTNNKNNSLASANVGRAQRLSKLS